VQETEGLAAKGIHYGMQINSPNTLYRAHQESILRKIFPRTTALDMLLTEAGIGFLNHGHLLWCQFDGMLQGLLFQLEQTLIATAQLLLVQDVLNGRSTDRGAFQLEHITELVAAPGWMLETQG
jgi:hypothetical protein